MSLPIKECTDLINRLGKMEYGGEFLAALISLTHDKNREIFSKSELYEEIERLFGIKIPTRHSYHIKCLRHRRMIAGTENQIRLKTLYVRK
jgi:hypothetical protein